jgi:hypothetical protein
MVDIGTISLVAIIAAILSTVVSVAIAFVAPLFSHGVKLAEFRQAWINDQRKDVADYMGLARDWVEVWERTNSKEGLTDEERNEFINLAVKDRRSDEEDLKLSLLAAKTGRTDEEQQEIFTISNKALVILWRIKLRMNPLETNAYYKQDQEFLKLLGNLIEPPPPGHTSAESRWRIQAEKAVAQAQVVFKTEWEVTKKTTVQSGLEKWRAWREKQICL